MTFLDFFAGIGGFRIGMEQAGHKCLGHCEKDKFANQSYRAMHDVREDEWFGEDITRVRASELPRADCWCLGFPCQDISVAGKQIGFDGKRSSLFFAVTRLIRDTREEDRPSTLFIENVKNLFSVNGGIDFLKLLVELDEIGYDAEWQLLNSKDFGVPQNRERVFIIGHLRGRSGREVFPIRQGDGVSSEEWLEATASISALTATDYKGPSKQRPNLVVPSIQQIGNCMPGSNRDNPNQGRVYDTAGISPALCKMEGGGRQPMIVQPVLTPDRAEKRQNGRRFKEDGEPMFTLTGQDRHGVMITEATKQGYAEAYEGDSINLAVPGSKTRRGRVGKGVANTLDTSCNQATIQGARIRRLTPRECFRLQGFSDEYFGRARVVNSDSQLYKQAGNSVTVPVIYEIAKRL